MVGRANEDFVGGPRAPKPNPYEVVTESQLKMYGLKEAARIDIPTVDPMKFDMIADQLEELAGRLRRARLMASGNQPTHLILLGAAADIRSTHLAIKAITKSGSAK